MQFLKNWGWVIALVIAILAFSQGGSAQLGNTTASFWDAQSGFRVNGTEIVDSSRNATFVDGTFSGGDLDVTTSNTATSTVSGGCFEGVATSTDTIVHFELGIETVASTTFSGGSSQGTVLWAYGSCPV